VAAAKHHLSGLLGVGGTELPQQGTFRIGRHCVEVTMLLKKLEGLKNECLDSDWFTYGAQYAAATSTEQKLAEVFDLNSKLPDKGKATVSLLPLYSPMPKYITLDTTGLFELLKECEWHKKHCKARNGCNRCVGRKPIARSEKDIRRFLWHRVANWLKYFAIPDKLLLAKDEEAVPGQSYFNSMIFTDGVGVSISTFRWVRKNRRKQTSEDSATPSGMSIAEQKSMTSYSYNRRAKRKRESSPTAPLSSARSPVVSLTSVPITYPTTVPLPSEPSIVLPSRAGVKRKHTPEPTSNTGDEHIAVSVPSTAPVLTPGPEPPPPVSMTEPESMPIGQPNDQVV
ncbi:hypothetical protein LPJ71_011445, partial [Coemansia sp. S17]